MNEIEIKSGDTLSKLAEKYGTSVSELARINNIDDVNKIYAGDKLKLTARRRREVPKMNEELIPPAIPVAPIEKVEVQSLPTLNEVPIPEPRPSPPKKEEEEKSFFDTLFDEPHKNMYVQGLQAYRTAEKGGKPRTFTEKDSDIFIPEILTAIDTAAEHFYGDNAKENQKKFLENVEKDSGEEKRKEFEKIFAANGLEYRMINRVFNTRSIFADNYDIKNPSGYIKTILGQFKVTEDDKGNWRVQDRYDFSPVGNILTASLGSLGTLSSYPMARYLGGKIAPEGKGGKSTPFAPYIDLTIPRTKLTLADKKKDTAKV